MMRTLRFSLLAFLLVGCDLYPKEAYLSREDMAAPAMQLADTCTGDVPVVVSSSTDFPIDLRSLNDDFRDLAACTGASTPGADGFFAVEMEAGEKWHFHLSVPSGELVNPAIYVLDSCDDRRCQPGDGIDVCGGEQDEHFSFVAPRAGTYFVGIDARTTGGAQYELLAVRPECGNGGSPEHSETCDDGNTISGDGCDERCRAELGAGALNEVEPNDDLTGANVFTPPLSIDAIIGGRCDVDHFTFTHGGGPLRASMLAGGSVACTDPPVGLELRLLASDGLTLRGTGAPTADNDCPVLDLADLAAGEYFLRVSAPFDARTFGYVLDVE